MTLPGPGPDGPGAEDPTTRLPRVVDPDPEADTGPLPQVPAEDEARDEPRMPTLMEQMGGLEGIIASTVPIAVFVVANVLFELQPALIAAVASAVLVTIYRIVRKQRLQPAVSGFLGVGICAFIAYRTGEARGFYLPGLLYSSALGLAFLVSILVRWPLAGVIWNGINGHGQGWRKDRRMLAAYSWASALWAVVFAARVVVQGWLYNADEETWLGIARLAMGYPLVIVAILGTVVAVRRAERTPAQDPTAPDPTR